MAIAPSCAGARPGLARRMADVGYTSGMGFPLLQLAAVAATLTAPNTAVAPTTPPPLATVVRQVLARDDQTQRELKGMEYDERVLTERLNAQGKVTQHQELQLIVRPGAKQELQVVSVHGDDLPTDPDEAARQAKGKELQRRQQTIDLKSISTRFNLAFQGESDELGTPAYILSFEPKANQPYHSQTEKVLNQLHGRIWIRKGDATILRTEATLLHPVQVAWIFASITRLDFHYELSPTGSEYGPAWLETSVEVTAPLFDLVQRQRIDMTHFRAVTPGH